MGEPRRADQQGPCAAGRDGQRRGRPGRPWKEMRSNKAAHAAELNSRPLLRYIALQVIYVLKKGCDESFTT